MNQHLTILQMRWQNSSKVPHIRRASNRLARISLSSAGRAVLAKKPKFPSQTCGCQQNCFKLYHSQHDSVLSSSFYQATNFGQIATCLELPDASHAKCIQKSEVFHDISDVHCHACNEPKACSTILIHEQRVCCAPHTYTYVTSHCIFFQNL